jgi:hypothetical protein
MEAFSGWLSIRLDWHHFQKEKAWTMAQASSRFPKFKLARSLSVFSSWRLSSPSFSL